jgi:nucleotide-binding universal stress UspA family protein
MFDTILWATDGSPCCDHALGAVRGLCEHYGSSLWVVHVVQKLGGEHLPGPTVIPDEGRVIAKLKAQTSSLRRHEINASLHVIRGALGQPAYHIVDIAHAVNADLIVVGVRGRSPLESMRLGSVTQRLLAIAPCPVLVMPASVPASRRSASHPASGTHRAGSGTHRAGSGTHRAASGTHQGASPSVTAGSCALPS